MNTFGIRSVAKLQLKSLARRYVKGCVHVAHKTEVAIHPGVQDQIRDIEHLIATTGEGVTFFNNGTNLHRTEIHRKGRHRTNLRREAIAQKLNEHNRLVIVRIVGCDFNSGLVGTAVVRTVCDGEAALLAWQQNPRPGLGGQLELRACARGKIHPGLTRAGSHGQLENAQVPHQELPLTHLAQVIHPEVHTQVAGCHGVIAQLDPAACVHQTNLHIRGHAFAQQAQNHFRTVRIVGADRDAAFLGAFIHGDVVHSQESTCTRFQFSDWRQLQIEISAGALNERDAIFIPFQRTACRNIVGQHDNPGGPLPQNHLAKIQQVVCLSTAVFRQHFHLAVIVPVLPQPSLRLDLTQVHRVFTAHPKTHGHKKGQEPK